jgi:FkbM family methyltransferase
MGMNPGGWRTRVAKALGPAALRAFSKVDPFARVSYAQEGEDQILLRALHDVSRGFYVDVGAHHPMRFSNTYLFYLRGWRGLNIEPDPSVQREMNRARPRDINLPFGVSDMPGELNYFRFNEPALNTFDVALAKQRQRPPYFLQDTIKVPVFCLDELLSRYLPARTAIDFLTVDAEGFDYKVLVSNDWTRFRPRYVVAEAIDTSLETLPSDPIHGLLSGYGYELLSKALNSVIYLDRDRIRT